jgi:signal transduction histidine kinase
MVAVPLMLLLAGAGGYLVAGRALKPIGTIAATARAIAEGDLSRRINPTGPQDELHRLAETFDEMIVSIDHLMTAQKRFFADASHELRTPLTVVLGALEVRLRTQNATVPELRQSMEVAQDEARHMKRLVDHLMTLSRADSGQEILHLRTTELTELLKSTGETAQWMMEGRQLVFELQNEVLLTCDRERLRQLVLNLLSNAVQHTTQEGMIILSLTATAEEIKICVADNGSGIAAQHLPHIFERFYRADPTRSRESGGSGLGLSICSWIAQAHGGTISAQSQVGQGTTITLLLPRFPRRD